MLKENKKSNFKKSVLMGAMLLAPSVVSAGQKVSNSNTSITAHADTTGSESFSSYGQGLGAAGNGASRLSSVRVGGSYRTPATHGDGTSTGSESHVSSDNRHRESSTTTNDAGMVIHPTTSTDGVTANQNLNGGVIDKNETGSSTASTTVARPFTTTIKIVNGNNGETVNSAVVTYTPNSQGTAYSVSTNNPQLAKYVNGVVPNTQVENYLQVQLDSMSKSDTGQKVYNDFFFGDDKWQLTPNEQPNANQDAVVTHDQNGNLVMTFSVYPKTPKATNNNNDGGSNIVVPIDDKAGETANSSSNNNNSNNNAANNNTSNNNTSNNNSSNGKVNDSQNKSVIQEAINERNAAQKALSTVDLKGKDITQIANLLKQYMKHGNIQILRDNRIGIIYSNSAGQQVYRYTVTFDSSTGSLTWSPLINFASGQPADLTGIKDAQPKDYSNNKNTNNVDGKGTDNKDGQNTANNSANNGFGTGANGNALGTSSASDLAQTATNNDENSASAIAVLGVSLLGTAGIMTLNKKKIY